MALTVEYTFTMLYKFTRSFSYAFIGLGLVWRKGLNFKFQLLCALVVLPLGWFFNVSNMEFVILLLVITLVLATETFNTALEELCDKFQPSHDPHIARIKDLSAAAVLVTSLGAAIIGAIIFIPHLW